MKALHDELHDLFGTMLRSSKLARWPRHLDIDSDTSGYALGQCGPRLWAALGLAAPHVAVQISLPAIVRAAGRLPEAEREEAIRRTAIGVMLHEVAHAACDGVNTDPPKPTEPAAFADFITAAKADPKATPAFRWAWASHHARFILTAYNLAFRARGMSLDVNPADVIDPAREPYGLSDAVTYIRAIGPDLFTEGPIDEIAARPIPPALSELFTRDVLACCQRQNPVALAEKE